MFFSTDIVLSIFIQIFFLVYCPYNIYTKEFLFVIYCPCNKKIGRLDICEQQRWTLAIAVCSLIRVLRGLDAASRLSAILFYKGGNFCDFRFAFRRIKSI